MSGTDRLAAPPAGVRWEFPAQEYARRLSAVRQRMAATGVDCLFLTSEKNIRYFTGFSSQIWISPTRPRYVLLPLTAEPIAIVPSSQAPGFAAATWITDIRSWPAPRPADDGISLVVEALRTLVKPGRKVAAEMGPETRLGMPVADFLRVREALPGHTFVDAGEVVRPVRLVKSSAEVACIHRAAQVGSKAFARLPEMVQPGLTERELCRKLHVLLLEIGADDVPYLVPVSGPHGFDQISMGPGDRALQPGDLLCIDVGVTFCGYFCDFNRDFALGGTTAEFTSAYDRVWEATQAGLEAVRPGRSVAEVWREMAAVLGLTGTAPVPAGRLGHGIGLDLTEPPSLALHDETVLEPGMVITLEPSLVLPPAGGLSRRLMVLEENLVVTEKGGTLLTERAPANLPLI